MDVSRIKKTLRELHDICFKSALRELQTILEQLFEDVKPETKSTLLGKAYVFTDLKLKPDFIQTFGVPLLVSEGRIQHVETTVDFLNLMSSKKKTFSVLIKGVRLKLTAAPTHSTVAHLLERQKTLQLVIAGLFRSVAQQGSKRGSSLLDALLRAEISIQDVKIEYSDPFTQSEMVLHLDKIDQFNENSMFGKKLNRASSYKFEGLRVDAFADEGKQSGGHVPTDAQKRSILQTVGSSTLLAPLSGAITIHHEYIPSVNDDPGFDEEDVLQVDKNKSTGFRAGSIDDTISRIRGEFLEDDEAYGLTVVIAVSNPLEITLHKHSLELLHSFVTQVSRPLFTDTRGKQISLDLLRWYPVRGHEKEYWKFCLRKALPEIIKKVATTSGVSMTDQLANSYGLLAPQEHKEIYINLYQRSLNLVHYDPLTAADVVEKKVTFGCSVAGVHTMLSAFRAQQLEATHATDTILIWRTEAQLRLIYERPEANSRVERTEFKDLESGIWSALFTLSPNVGPARTLRPEDKLVTASAQAVCIRMLPDMLRFVCVASGCLQARPCIPSGGTEDSQVQRHQCMFPKRHRLSFSFVFLTYGIASTSSLPSRLETRWCELPCLASLM